MHKQMGAESRYLDTFRKSLSQLPRAEQAEITAELRCHIVEATRAGEDLTRVLERLGPPHRLAAAYTAEMLISPRSRWLRAAGIVAVTSLPSLVLVPTLSILSFGLSLGGVVAVLVSVASLFVPSLARSSLPFGVAQAVGVLLGLLLAAAGAGTFLALRAYLRLAVRALRTAL